MKPYAKVRADLGVNQSEFWSRVGVTQSGGSRYETGRKPGKPVQMLLALAYGTEKERKAVMKQLGIQG